MSDQMISYLLGVISGGIVTFHIALFFCYRWLKMDKEEIIELLRKEDV